MASTVVPCGLLLIALVNSVNTGRTSLFYPAHRHLVLIGQQRLAVTPESDASHSKRRGSLT